MPYLDIVAKEPCIPGGIIFCLISGGFLDYSGCLCAFLVEFITSIPMIPRSFP